MVIPTPTVRSMQRIRRARKSRRRDASEGFACEPRGYYVHVEARAQRKAALDHSCRRGLTATPTTARTGGNGAAPRRSPISGSIPGAPV
jgi:hypothetical protein